MGNGKFENGRSRLNETAFPDETNHRGFDELNVALSKVLGRRQSHFEITIHLYHL